MQHDNSKDGTTAESISGVLLVFRHRQLVRNLAGFKKSNHRIPDEITDRTQKFVGKLGSSQVRDDLDRVFDSLRTAFRFKRTELKTQETDDGAGSIITPFFRYTSCVYQDSSNADEAIWQRDVSEIANPNHLVSDEFISVFGSAFDTVELVPPSTINLEALIDHVEALEDSRVSLQYDRQVTHCEMAIEGMNAKIHVTPDAFRIVHAEPSSPRILADSFFSVRMALADFSAFGESEPGTAS